MNDQKQFKDKVELSILERINESHAIEGFDMSIKFNKARIQERCLQILKSRKFKDLLYQRHQRNKMSEDTFLKLMEIHCSTKKRSENPDQYLQSKDISAIIKDYVQQNYESEKIRKEKIENFLKLLLSVNPGENSKNFEEFYDDESYQDENFLKVHLEFFQTHLLKIDKQNQILIEENKELKEHSKQILQQNEEFKKQLNKILTENSFIKLKSESVLLKNNELKSELLELKSQSLRLLNNTEDLKSKVETIIQSNEQIKCQSTTLLDKISPLPQIQNCLINMNKTIPTTWLTLNQTSTIIGNAQYGEIQRLMEWIERKEQKFCKLSLIYRGSRDGFTTQTFHSQCDYLSPTISLIRSDRNKIFGGYTEQTWNYSGTYKRDDEAFLFSFSNNEKYPIQSPRFAISTRGSSLVNYGHNGDIYISNDCNTNRFSRIRFPCSYSCSKFSYESNEGSIYLAGAVNFKVIDIEVFAVSWI